MHNLAIIPARGGSKRIPGKNIKFFLGKPIIAYSIEAALKTGLFDEIMVSTEDKNIANIAKTYGASIPFYRSPDNADDYATLSDVLIEVVNNYNKLGLNFDNICCILPTAPLISVNQIREAYKKLYSEQVDSICAIVKFSYPIFRSLEFSGQRLKMIWPEYLRTRSQDLKTIYHDAGSFYWIKSSALLKEKTLYCKEGSGYELTELQVQDIDSEIDWQLAELKYKLLYQ